MSNWYDKDGIRVVGFYSYAKDPRAFQQMDTNDMVLALTIGLRESQLSSKDDEARVEDLVLGVNDNPTVAKTRLSKVQIGYRPIRGVLKGATALARVPGTDLVVQVKHGFGRYQNKRAMREAIVRHIVLIVKTLHEAKVQTVDTAYIYAGLHMELPFSCVAFYETQELDKRSRHLLREPLKVESENDPQ